MALIDPELTHRRIYIEEETMAVLVFLLACVAMLGSELALFWPASVISANATGSKSGHEIALRQTNEGESTISINAEGFRDGDHVTRKHRNTLRIAVRGDSYVFATDVEIGERFTERLPHDIASTEPSSEDR